MWCDRLNNYTLSVIISVFLFDVIVQENVMICSLGEMAAGGIIKLKTASASAVSYRLDKNESTLRAGNRLNRKYHASPASSLRATKKATSKGKGQFQREMVSVSKRTNEASGNSDEGNIPSNKLGFRFDNDLSHHSSERYDSSNDSKGSHGAGSRLRKVTAGREGYYAAEGSNLHDTQIPQSLQRHTKHRIIFATDSEEITPEVDNADEVDSHEHDLGLSTRKRLASYDDTPELEQPTLADQSLGDGSISHASKLSSKNNLELLEKDQTENETFSEGNDAAIKSSHAQPKLSQRGKWTNRQHVSGDDIHTNEVEEEHAASEEGPSDHQIRLSSGRSSSFLASENVVSRQGGFFSHYNYKDAISKESLSDFHPMQSLSRISSIAYAEAESRMGESIDDSRMLGEAVRATPRLPVYSTTNSNSTPKAGGDSIVAPQELGTLSSAPQNVRVDAFVSTKGISAKSVHPKSTKLTSDGATENSQQFTIINNSAEDFLAATAAVSASFAAVIQI